MKREEPKPKWYRRGRGFWSEAGPSRFEPLPCRQDLPSEAEVVLQELREVAFEMRSWPLASIIAISHCWLNPDHPDPHGYLLKELSPVIEAYLQDDIDALWHLDSFPCNDSSGAFFFA